MAESSNTNSLSDRLIGPLYAMLYQTRRKNILGISIAGWLRNLPWIFALVAWPLELGLGWIVFGVTLAVVIRFLYWRGRRVGYIRFVSEDNQMVSPGSESTGDNEKVAVLASGTFSVKDWETYVLQHPAQYWRVGMGDHALMVNYEPGRFLYQFIQPGRVEEVVQGRLCSGRKPQPALEITYLSNWGPESTDVSFMFYSAGKDKKPAKLRRKIYLAFDSLEQRGRVLNSLVRDLDQTIIKES